MPIDATEEPAKALVDLVARFCLSRAVIDGVTDHAIIAHDPGGRVILWNEGARRLYGYEAHEIIGKPGSTLSVKGDGATEQRFETARAMGKWQGLIDGRRRDGTQFLAPTTLAARHDTEGQLLGFTEISQNPTESKRVATTRGEPLEAGGGRFESNVNALQPWRARTAAEKKKALFATLSHDLRTPLNGIIGFAELLHRGKLGPVSATHKEYLGDILK